MTTPRDQALSAKLRAERKRARETSAQIDEGLLSVSKGIDRLLRDRAELIAAAEAVLAYIDDTDARHALAAAVSKAQAT